MRGIPGRGTPAALRRTRRRADAAAILNANGATAERRAAHARSLERWVRAAGVADAGPAAHPAPLVRHAPARRRRRPARRAGAAGPRQPGQTTQIYTHLSDAALRSAYREAHPRSGRAGAGRRAVKGTGRARRQSISGDPVADRRAPGASPLGRAGHRQPDPHRRRPRQPAARLDSAARDRLASSAPASELDAYFAAFRIPDAIFQLVVAGALSAALIPVFSSYRARGDEDEAWRLASSIINLVLIALTGQSC